MKIYFVNGIDAFDDSFVEKCSSFFHEWRKDKMLSYKFLKGRIQSALAYLLLIHSLTFTNKKARRCRAVFIIHL